VSEDLKIKHIGTAIVVSRSFISSFLKPIHNAQTLISLHRIPYGQL